MKSFPAKILKAPALYIILILIAVIAVLWFVPEHSPAEKPDGITEPVVSETSATTAAVTSTTSSTSSTTKTSTSTSTTSTTSAIKTNSTATTTSITTVSETTAAASTATATQTDAAQQTEASSTAPPPASLSPYIGVGDSPNSALYQEKLVIAGDSIAFGFNVYGFIPNEHNLAKESLSMWNLKNFTFNFGYGNISLIDAVSAIKPELLYMSLGMNDLNMNSGEGFASRYSDVLRQIKHNNPDINIVVAGITPIADYVTYSNNTNIRSYNEALRNAVNTIGLPDIYYFDAYSVLADPNTLAMRSDCSSGDGIHISSASYKQLLTALFNFLDTTPVKTKIS